MEQINKSDNKVSKVITVKRREYGTPVDCVDIMQPPLVHPQKYYYDNEPSCSKHNSSAQVNNTSGSIDKKKINRRKKRAKQMKRKTDEVKSAAPNDILDELSQNLRNMLLPKTNTSQTSIKQDIVNNETNIQASQHVTFQNISKSSKPKQYTKVITNSKFKAEELESDDKKNSKANVLNISTKYFKKDSISNYNQTTKRTKQIKSNNEEEIPFEEYLTKEETEAGLKTGELSKGYIRINPKDYKSAYVASPNKGENDLILEGMRDRNRALEGDLVVVRVKTEDQWRSPKQKTAVVVHIVQHVHSRTAVGKLRMGHDRGQRYARFEPRDSRIPHIRIPFTDWPVSFGNDPDMYQNTLYLAKITEWSNLKYATGTILENIGMSGDIRAETTAILKENCLNVTPYSDDVRQYYPSTDEIAAQELTQRLDLRNQCVFTIDPLTARDLDDAVSCTELPNGNLEVGVHISDVGYYLHENTPLDEMVAERATSTYMVESVYHMLPKELCMMCSLLPGRDKLAFSVLWEMTRDGQVISHKFSRTVINSCTQLAYEHAQAMLDEPQRRFTADTLPAIYNGHTPDELSTTVNRLNAIALKLRKGRFDGGALRIDQLKLCFQIDPVTCQPISYCVYENKESHRLIEEFMLLANMTVATYLREQYPDIAFLRSHPAPNDLLTGRLQALLEKVGILLDVTSAGALQRSLWAYTGSDDLSHVRMLVLCHLSAKTMTRAQYFCANSCDKPDKYWHYALNIPLYTHFTSPIRRYADIMVHRQLAGALGCATRPAWPVDYVIDIAANCNKQKYNAKRAGEQSLELYYMHYVAQQGSLDERAVVCEVRETSFDVIVLTSGILCRMFLNVLPKRVKYEILDEDGREIVTNNSKRTEEREFTADKKIKTLVISWPETKVPAALQVVSLFTVVTVRLRKHDKRLKLEAELLRPTVGQQT